MILLCGILVYANNIPLVSSAPDNHYYLTCLLVNSPAHIKRRLVGKCLKTHSLQQTIFVSSVLDWNKPANEANAGRPLISKRHKISFLAIVPAWASQWQLSSNPMPWIPKWATFCVLGFHFCPEPSEPVTTGHGDQEGGKGFGSWIINSKSYFILIC